MIQLTALHPPPPDHHQPETARTALLQNKSRALVETSDIRNSHKKTLIRDVTYNVQLSYSLAGRIKKKPIFYCFYFVCYAQMYLSSPLNECPQLGAEWFNSGFRLTAVCKCTTHQSPNPKQELWTLRPVEDALNNPTTNNQYVTHGALEDYSRPYASDWLCRVNIMPSEIK